MTRSLRHAERGGTLADKRMQEQVTATARLARLALRACAEEVRRLTALHAKAEEQHRQKRTDLLPEFRELGEMALDGYRHGSVSLLARVDECGRLAHALAAVLNDDKATGVRIAEAIDRLHQRLGPLCEADAP